MNASFSLSQAFDQAGVALEQRDQVTSVVAARRAAYALPMPTEPMNSPVDFFNEHLASAVEQSLCNMNEAAVMDVDFAIAVSRLYWLARYRVLYVPESSEAMQAVTGLVDQLLAQEPVKDLGMVQDPNGTGAGTGTVVTVVDGRTTLAGLQDAVEAMVPSFDQLWTESLSMESIRESFNTFWADISDKEAQLTAEQEG